MNDPAVGAILASARADADKVADCNARLRFYKELIDGLVEEATRLMAERDVVQRRAGDALATAKAIRHAERRA